MQTSNTGGGAFYGGRRASFAQIGGALGVAGNCLGWLIFIFMCLGYGAAGALGPLPFVLGIIGLILCILGPTTQPDAPDIDTHVLAGIFASIFAIIGGALEFGVFMHWQVVWFTSVAK